MIFRGSGSLLLGNPIFLLFFRGVGGSGSPAPLWICPREASSTCTTYTLTPMVYEIKMHMDTSYTVRMNLHNIQVLAFQKSWRSFSPITVCIIAQCQCRTGGEAGGTCPYPPRRGRGECPKKTFVHCVWGGLGCFG